MTQPTHYIVDGDAYSVVFPQGYDPADLIELPAGYWDTLWRYDGEELVEDMETIRGLAWQEAKLIREAARSAGCDTPLGRVQTDPTSLNLLFGYMAAATAAEALGEPFAVDITMSDNSVVSHDAAAVAALVRAVAERLALCQSVSMAIRADLAAASSGADVRAISLDSGYPA